MVYYNYHQQQLCIVTLLTPVPVNPKMLFDSPSSFRSSKVLSSWSVTELQLKAGLFLLFLSHFVCWCPCMSSSIHYLSIYLSIYGSTALCWTLAAFSVSWSFTQSVGLFGREIIPSQGRYLHTEQHKRRINTHIHPCLKRDSNQRSQCLRRRRQVHALDRVATVIGSSILVHRNLHNLK
jgi:hypothetical protein